MPLEVVGHVLDIFFLSVQEPALDMPLYERDLLDLLLLGYSDKLWKFFEAF